MFNLNFILSLSLIAISCFGYSNACETTFFIDSIKKVKEGDGESKIKESSKGFYIDSSLLFLQKDGIYLIHNNGNFLLPLLYHDTEGYFLSKEFYHDLGSEWMCCRCNHNNSNFSNSCEVCLNERCGH